MPVYTPDGKHFFSYKDKSPSKGSRKSNAQRKAERKRRLNRLKRK